MKRFHVHLYVSDPPPARLSQQTVCRRARPRRGGLRQMDADRSAGQFRHFHPWTQPGLDHWHPGGQRRRSGYRSGPRPRLPTRRCRTRAKPPAATPAATNTGSPTPRAWRGSSSTLGNIPTFSDGHAARSALRAGLLCPAAPETEAKIRWLLHRRHRHFLSRPMLRSRPNQLLWRAVCCAPAQPTAAAGGCCAPATNATPAGGCCAPPLLHPQCRAGGCCGPSAKKAAADGRLFHTGMAHADVVRALAALAHDARAGRVQAAGSGRPDGLAAGCWPEQLAGCAPALSFHLKELTRGPAGAKRPDGLETAPVHEPAHRPPDRQ